MSITKISPVAEFLRANHAIAKNHNAYRAYPTGELVKSCDFYDLNGNFLGRMTRTGTPINGKPSFALFKSYIETMESGYKAGFRQVKENAIHFAKVIGLNGEKESYLPEKMTKTHTIIDNQGYKTEDKLERTISSKIKLIKEADKNAYGYVPQNTYLAEEPVKYQEKLLSHQVTKSDKF